MTPGNGNINSRNGLDQLRDILLKNDREELDRIRQLLEERDQLSSHISPIIEEHITFLKNNYPEEFRKVVEQQIETKLKDSQEDLISVIYPAVGEMIKKYVAHQILLLRESVEDGIEDAKNSGPIGWFRRNILGIKNIDWAMAKVGEARIEAIYVVEKGSGILLGSASVAETGDEDLLAGMLTAIQGFAEDAFMKGVQKVDTIEYERLTIFIQTFPKFYIAVSLNGKLTNTDKDRLTRDLLNFTSKKLNRVLLRERPNKDEEIRKQLHERFFPKGNEKISELFLSA